MRKIIFTGGGTGGHIMPNIAIINDIKAKYEIKYIGSAKSMEERIISPIVPFYSVTTCKLSRSFSLSNILIPFKLIKGIIDAKKILKKEIPNLVFSKGGYVSVPVVIASRLLKIPIISHESDLTLGLANKITSKFSKVVCTSFKATSSKIKNGIWTGSPIRKEILDGSKYQIAKKYYLNKNLPTLLVIGGSLGSSTINKIIFSNSKILSTKFNILHICGKNSKLVSQISNYHIIQFTNRIQDFYSACDIAITRGGSNVIFELLSVKKPMLIIPLKKGSRGDQIENANEFYKDGLCEMADEDAILSNSNILFEKLSKLMSNKDHYINALQKYSKKSIGNKKIIKIIEDNLK